MGVIKREIEKHRSTYSAGDVRDLIDLSLQKQAESTLDADCFTGNLARTLTVRQFNRWVFSSSLVVSHYIILSVVAKFVHVYFRLYEGHSNDNYMYITAKYYVYNVVNGINECSILVYSVNFTLLK